jgi:large subunit ribosomal protein L28
VLFFGARRLPATGCLDHFEQHPGQHTQRNNSAPHQIQEKPVAANCDVCGKGPSFGHNISHSHRRTKRRWNPNIQRVKALVGVAGVTPKRLNVCTSCLKAGKVKR